MDDTATKTTSANNENSSGTAIAATIFFGFLIVAALIWYFGIDVALKGIGGLLLIAFIATGVGAVIVGVVIFLMGKPVVSLLPLIWLGLKTLAVIVGIVAFLFIIFSLSVYIISILSSSSKDNG